MKILYMPGTRMQAEKAVKRLAQMLEQSPIEGISLKMEGDEPFMTNQGEYVLNIESDSIYSNILARGVAEHHGFIIIEEES